MSVSKSTVLPGTIPEMPEEGVKPVTVHPLLSRGLGAPPGWWWGNYKHEMDLEFCVLSRKLRCILLYIHGMVIVAST